MITFHVLTLFPEMIARGLDASILGRAVDQKIIAVNPVDIREYTDDKHGRVDDTPYGGGAGMLMQAQPVYDAHRAVSGGKQIRTLYVTPQGKRFCQKMAQELAKEEELILLCGHYEGIDERALEEVVTDYVSIGDYVLTGGELAAMVMIDAVARLVPGVLGNGASAQEESFFNDLLEYPQYTRPEIWRGKRVPEVLLSGNHEKIRNWRLEQSRERTKSRRPDLYGRYQERQRLMERLSGDKRNQIPLMECLARGQGSIVSVSGEDAAVYHRESGVCMVKASSPESGRFLLSACPGETKRYLVGRDFMAQMLKELGCVELCRCRQFLYTRKVPLPVPHKEIRKLEPEDLPHLLAVCGGQNRSYLEERLRSGAVYGVFRQGKLTGCAGIHAWGGLGMLYVAEDARGNGIGSSLEAYVINRLLERGYTPYGHVPSDREAALGLQEKLGLYQAGDTFYWLERPAPAKQGQSRGFWPQNPA